MLNQDLLCPEDIGIVLPVQPLRRCADPVGLAPTLGLEQIGLGRR